MEQCGLGCAQGQFCPVGAYVQKVQQVVPLLRGRAAGKKYNALFKGFQFSSQCVGAVVQVLVDVAQHAFDLVHAVNGALNDACRHSALQKQERGFDFLQKWRCGGGNNILLGHKMGL